VKQFGDNIKFLREKLGLTQSQMIDTVGIPSKSWSKYERGENEPKYEQLVKISIFFGVDVDTLLKKNLILLEAQGNLILKKEETESNEKGNLNGNPNGNLKPKTYEKNEEPPSIVAEPTPEVKHIFQDILEELRGLRRDINKTGTSSPTEP
jgi:transcriptional regulator with XRE-family HTH domain